MADRNAINLGLKELSKIWKGAYTIADLETMLPNWERAFPDVNNAEFLAACQEAISRCRFFPKPVEVRGFVDEIRQRNRTSTPALPSAPISDAQKQRNRMHAANMRARFAGELLPFPEVARGMMDVDAYQTRVRAMQEHQQAQAEEARRGERVA